MRKLFCGSFPTIKPYIDYTIKKRIGNLPIPDC
nr:MAG TPA: hypothetical protein [Caudoviricetes sp.]